jgi:hypothetical protein
VKPVSGPSKEMGPSFVVNRRKNKISDGKKLFFSITADIPLIEEEPTGEIRQITTQSQIRPQRDAARSRAAETASEGGAPMITSSRKLGSALEFPAEYHRLKLEKHIYRVGKCIKIRGGNLRMPQSLVSAF